MYREFLKEKKMDNIETITINDTKYIKLDDANKNKLAENVDGMEYCVVRTYSAGVHIGYVESLDGKQCVLINSRRLYLWEGACSLSQVAIDGVDVGNSKIAMVLPKITLTEAIEVIPCSEKAKNCIIGAEEWKK